ncbi:HutD family protein [Pseudomonas sp. K1(2024)]|uniref:HutD family protein n=1 Tax=Pseudomonas boreofloridensis TaxID=3064348 RepID=A0ABV4ZD26_9PSED
MSGVRVLRARDYPRMPWKNGGGSTEEIARDAGEGLEGFGWRLSIADIESSGGFSRFAGYQRIISVLQGDGMYLTVDGQRSRLLRVFDAFAFKGDSEVACTLPGGGIRDFNLIYAPDLYRARLQWFEGRARFFSDAGTVVVFGGGGEVGVEVDGGGVLLGGYDCLLVSGREGVVGVEVSGGCCVVELTRVGG